MAISRARLLNRNLFLLLSAFPLLPLHWISLVTILLLFSALFIVFSEKLFAFDLRFWLLLSAPVLVFIAFLPASENIDLAYRSISVKGVLPALGLALAFKHVRPDRKTLDTSITIFCFASVALIVWCHMLLGINGFTHPIGLDGADFAYSYRVSIERYAGLHPTYYCAIVYTAAFIALYRLLYPPVAANRTWIWILVLGFGCIAGILAASRATMFAFILISLATIVWRLRGVKYNWVYLLVVLLATASLLFIPSIRNRLSEMNAQNMRAPERNNDNGTNVRAGIFSCNATLLQTHWLWGLGPGDVQGELNACLSAFDTHVYAIHNYNTHNEYINYWLTCGIAGLVVFVGVLLAGLIISIRAKNWLYAYLIVFMVICFLTENYLDRQAGVTLFAWLQTIFLIDARLKKEIQ